MKLVSQKWGELTELVTGGVHGRGMGLNQRVKEGGGRSIKPRVKRYPGEGGKGERNKKTSK